MTDHQMDPWDEFDRLRPAAPTASRATPEVSGDGQWLLLGLMVLIEAIFVFAFSQLVDQARNRRSAR